MKNKNNLKVEAVTIAALIILVIEIAVIMICNMTLQTSLIESDMAKLYVHVIEMCKNHTFAIKDWSYVSTMEIDCATLFAGLIFYLTDNIYISFGIANLILIMILVWTLFALFPKEKKSYPLICADFILIPYSIGQLDYFNMMFFNGSQYIIKVLLPLLFVAIIINNDSIKAKKSKLINYIIFGVLLLISGISSGIYVFVCGLFPAIAIYVAYRFAKTEKIEIEKYIIIAATITIVGIGFLINKGIGANAKGNGMQLCAITDGRLHQNIISCIFGIFELFGGVVYENVPVISLKGITVLIKMLFVITMLIIALGSIGKTFKKKAETKEAMLISIFVWNTFVLSICDICYGQDTFEYRYHIMGMVPVIVLVSKKILDWSYAQRTKNNNGKIVMAAVIILCVALNITSYQGIGDEKKDVGTLQKICDSAIENNIEYAYFEGVTWAAEICRLLDYKNAVYLTVNPESSLTECYDYYEKYDKAAVEKQNTMIISPVNYGEEVNLYENEYKYISNIDGWNVYIQK